MRNLVLTLTSLFIGLLFVGCVPTLNSSSKEDCEKKSGYSWDAGSKRCVGDTVTVTDDDDDDDSITTTSGGSGNRRSGSGSYKPGDTSEVQLLDDYGCVLKSSDLYCWRGTSDPDLIEKDVDKYKLVSYKDLNMNEPTPGTSPTNKLAFALILTDDGKLIYQKNGSKYVDDYKIGEGFPRYGHSDVIDFQIHGGTVCAHMEDDSIKCWGDNTYNQVGHVAYDSTSGENNFVPFNNHEERGTIFGNREGLREFESFKMFGDEDTLGAGYMTGVCALNKNNHLYCWGKVKADALGLDDTFTDGNGDTITVHGKDGEIYEVGLADGTRDPEDFEVEKYEIAPNGKVMYAYGRKGTSNNEEWYVLADGLGTGGFGTELLQDEPIRMVGEDNEEDTSDIEDVYVTGGDTHCLITSDDLLRCTFGDTSGSDTNIVAANGNTEEKDFTLIERETVSSTDTKVDGSWFTAYGDDDDTIVGDGVYVFGSNDQHICWELSEDNTLDCGTFKALGENEEVSKLKFHEDALCLFNTDDELHCQRAGGVSQSLDDDAELDDFYIGGESGEEFFLAQVKDGRIYAWISSGDNEVFNGDDHSNAGFGDFDDEDDRDEDHDDDDDDLDALAFLDLDTIFTGSSLHIVGQSGSNYYRWGSVSGVEITDVKGINDEEDVDGNELDFE